MRRAAKGVACDESGVAALEMALIFPVLMVLLGGLTDFALAYWFKGVLAGSVGEGAQYSVLAGPNVSTSSIQNIVMQKLSLPASAVTITGPGCYCVSGMPASAISQSCTQACPNGTMPGTYVTISASYTYSPILPLYSQMSSPVLVETTMARMK